MLRQSLRSFLSLVEDMNLQIEEPERCKQDEPRGTQLTGLAVWLVVRSLPSMCRALGSIPSTEPERGREKGGSGGGHILLTIGSRMKFKKEMRDYLIQRHASLPCCSHPRHLRSGRPALDIKSCTAFRHRSGRNRICR